MRKKVTVKASEVIKYTWELYLDFDPSLTEEENRKYLEAQAHDFIQRAFNTGLQEEDGSGFQIDSIRVIKEAQ